MVNSELDKAAHCDFILAAGIIRKPNAGLAYAVVFSEELYWPGKPIPVPLGPKA